MAYNKYYLQKKQVSYDNGLTWEDVTPSETRQGAYIDSYQTLAECEGIPYSEQYLTFESKTNNNTIYWWSAFANETKTISASTDNGSTWTAYASSTGGSGTTIATLNTGDKVLIKGTNQAYTNNRFNSSGQFEMYGNIMSLLYGDNFSGQTALTDNYLFFSLFRASSGLTSAENLILPATTLTYGCYGYMFFNCTSLTKAPELPAATLVDGCYQYMFAVCSNLNYVKCLATNISATQSTVYWLSGVAANGTFVKDASMSSWTTGDSGIPSGWTVQNNS